MHAIPADQRKGVVDDAARVFLSTGLVFYALCVSLLLVWLLRNRLHLYGASSILLRNEIEDVSATLEKDKVVGAIICPRLS